MRKILSAMTLGAVVFGITLSTLHQSGLGALYLMAKGKIHPLWYSEFIPILFFVSSIFAGISLVIFEGSISHRVFADRISPENLKSQKNLQLDLARICAGAMFVYLFLQALVFIHEKRISYLGSPMYYWYLTEIIGFVLLPCLLFVAAMKRNSLVLVRTAAVMTLIGIILNRLNISVIAFKWYAPVRYYPTWMEVEITLAVIFTEIWVFRWFIHRMPVLNDPPAWALEQDAPAQETQYARVVKETIPWKPQA
jgi:Ni/Fe-hydrogenase subunit HybB-like protein